MYISLPLQHTLSHCLVCVDECALCVVIIVFGINNTDIHKIIMSLSIRHPHATHTHTHTRYTHSLSVCVMVSQYSVLESASYPAYVDDDGGDGGGSGGICHHFIARAFSIRLCELFP